MSEPALPTRFPIFPLPGTVLFPEAVLPLHVFEPRYRAMARDALAGDCVIGMVLVRPGNDPMQPEAPIFEVGCAGHMSRVQELPDGRYAFVITGERRFLIRSDWLQPAGYRCTEAEFLPDPDFAQLAPEEREQLETGRPRLEQKVFELVHLQSPDSVEPLRQRLARLDALALVRALAFALHCEPTAKQGLLTADSPGTQLELLAQLVEFLIAEARLPAGSPGARFAN